MTYHYICDCKEMKSIQAKMGEQPKTVKCICGKKMVRYLKPPAVVYKGSGFVGKIHKK